MYSIRDAKIRRLTEVGGTPCAEVEVYSASADQPDVLAYLAPSAPLGGYELVKVVRSDASMEYDWFDNSMHTAYEDATDAAFVSSTVATAQEEREAFRQQLLSAGTLSRQLNERFYGEGTVL